MSQWELNLAINSRHGCVVKKPTLQPLRFGFSSIAMHTGRVLSVITAGQLMLCERNA